MKKSNVIDRIVATLFSKNAPSTKSRGRSAAQSPDARHSGRFGIGLGVALSERLSVRVDYDYEIWQHVDMHHVGGNRTYRW